MAQAHYFRKGTSLFATTLSAGISTGTSETITPNSVTGLPTDTEITLTIDRIDSAGNATPTKMERITGIISGGNLTAYTRGIDGTSDQAHSSGAVVEYIWNADDLNDITDGILTEHNQDGTHQDITASSVTASHATLGITSQFPVVFGEYDNGNTGSAVTITWANGDRQFACVTASTTISFASAVAGQTLQLRTYHSASAYSVTLPTVKWPGGSADTPGTGSGASNIYVFYYDGTAYYVQLAADFS